MRTTGTTTTQTLSIDELVKLSAEMIAKKKEADDALVTAIKDVMRQEGLPHEDWRNILRFAAIMRVSPLDLEDVLDGVPPTWAFWEAVKRWGEPHRPK